MKTFERLIKALIIYNAAFLFIYFYVGLKDENADYPLLGALFVSSVCLMVYFVINKNFYIKHSIRKYPQPYGLYLLLWFALMGTIAFVVTRIAFCSLKAGAFVKYPACSLL
jgi:hypothetical protein